jgi:hypothetical protein
MNINGVELVDASEAETRSESSLGIQALNPIHLDLTSGGFRSWRIASKNKQKDLECVQT